ncbi:MAG: amidophosphoribosyltransferase [Kiritimatiellae bacterium]|nr:amidophosphoribosyltransferase [Kiritimatiellia bacterium]
MSDELRHECAVAMVVLRRPLGGRPAADFGGTKLSLLMEKQHNRGQDGAGAAILSSDPAPGEAPYWIAKSASSTPLADVLEAIGKREVSRRDAETQRTDLRVSATPREKIFLGHLRYATFGKNEVAFCHPFVHQASELEHTLLLAGNFNLTNAHELFEDYRHHGAFPTSKSDGYLICEMMAKALESQGPAPLADGLPAGQKPEAPVARAIASALASADGAWTLCGATGDGWAFATRDPHGIRPGFYLVNDDVVAVASERPAIQAAFDVPPEAVKEIPPGKALVVSPDGDVGLEALDSRQPTADTPPTTQPPNHPTTQPPNHPTPRPCVFERIYFSRANDADIHRERKALGAALLPQILKAAAAPLDDIFFSYIPNSARIAFHGLLEELINGILTQRHRGAKTRRGNDLCASEPSCLCVENKTIPRFGEIAVKDAKFRTFIADAAARREFYKHVYDVTYGLVRAGRDTLVVLDDSIVRGNTMKNAILPMLDRLGPKRIVIASSAPPIRYPDCYGIDMSTLGELVAFRALVNLLDAELGKGNGERELRKALDGEASEQANPLGPLYGRFTEEQHCAEIARLLTPPGMKAEVRVVYQSIDALHAACPGSSGDWYFTGDYPTPGGYRVLHRAILNYLAHAGGRSY